MKKWLKILFVIFIFAIISTIVYFVLKLNNLTDIEKIKNIILSSGKLGLIIYTLITATMLTLLCFVPLLNVSLTVLGIALFGSKIAFIANIIAIFISNSILFFIGDKLGEKFAIKLVGKKSLDEAQNLIHNKSKFWLPILFIAPVIPDESLCLVAGMTKMKYWYLMLVSFLYHTFEIGLFCFVGSGLIVWSALSILDWVVLINVILIDIYLLIKLEKYIEKHKNNSKNTEN